MSIRWWLALCFAAIVSLTAVVVAEVFTTRAESAFRNRAKELATGNAVVAASRITSLRSRAELEATSAAVAGRQRLALFVFDSQRRPLTPLRLRGIEFRTVPLRGEALDRALRGRRFVASNDAGKVIVVGLPLRGGGAGAALVAVALRPDLVAEIGILRNEIVTAALWAVFAGAVAGLIVALLIAARLRRISTAAAEIERGSFDTQLRPRFPDELGDLAATVDRMRERLRESFANLESERDRLRVLLEQLQEGVIAVNPELTVVFANAAARELIPVSLVEGEPLPELSPQLELRAFAARLFEADAGVSQARLSPQEDRSYAIAGIPASRSSPIVVIVLTDVTERERRERAEREFVANAAHELRTPIAAIDNALEALEMGAKELPEDRDRFLSIASRQTNRLGRLVRALLALARAQTRQEALLLEPIPVRALLEEAAATLDPPEAITIEVACPANLVVLAQRDLAAQVVANLAANAAKHTERGQIRLSARPTADDTVAIEVTDTGSGIAPKERDRIFDRFYSGDGEQREGFGLGLAIVREAVQALGGIVEIESEPERGTVARVILASAHAKAA